MSSPFVAEIKIFAGNFNPTGWATCDGQLLPLSQNTALFSLLGTMYGGDGKSTFALPNMAGNAPMAPTALAPQGGSLPHNNLMPYLTLTYIIALQGVFPPRS